jgi:hypothetical protein
MKKAILFYSQALLLVLFIVSILITVINLTGIRIFSRFDHEQAVYNHSEAYDPSLSRINTIKKLEQYCDSVYAARVFKGANDDFEKTYADIVSNAVRNKFYHGYSYYNFNKNYVGVLTAQVTEPGLSALVIPDDILKYNYAACSQQSIVMMEVLQNKGMLTRKIALTGKKFGGHFAFEVFYQGKWHFMDPNMEPNKAVLDRYDRPGIDFLARNPDILLEAYAQHPPEKILDILPNYAYGPVNKFPAPKAIVFQKLTAFLSYTVWLFFLVAFVFVRRSYLKVKRTREAKKQMAPIPFPQPGMA